MRAQGPNPTAARSLGRRDGQTSTQIVLGGAVPPGYRQVVEAARADLALSHSRRNTKVETLAEDARGDRDRAVEDRRDLEASFHRLRAEARQVEQAVRTDSDESYRLYQRRGVAWAGTVVDWLVLAGIGAAEVYVNLTVFQLFGLAAAPTLGVAIGLTLGLTVLEHRVGARLKVMAEGTPGRRRRTERTLLVIGGIALLGTIGTLSMVRGIDLSNAASVLAGKAGSSFYAPGLTVAVSVFAFTQLLFGVLTVNLGYWRMSPSLSALSTTRRTTAAAESAMRKAVGRARAAEGRLRRVEVRLAQALAIEAARTAARVARWRGALAAYAGGFAETAGPEAALAVAQLQRLLPVPGLEVDTWGLGVDHGPTAIVVGAGIRNIHREKEAS